MTRLDDRLHESGEDLYRAATTIAHRPIGRPRPIARGLRAVVVTFGLVGLVALPIWLGVFDDSPRSAPVGGGGDGSTSAGQEDESSPVTVAVPTEIGPISNQEFEAIHGPIWPWVVEGSAILVAQREDADYGPLRLVFFDSFNDDGLGDSKRCVTAFGGVLADPDPHGKRLTVSAGTLCGSTDSTVHDFGLLVGGTCAPGYESVMLSSYGLGDDATSATFVLTDGASVTVPVVNGVALAAWPGGAGVAVTTIERLDGRVDEYVEFELFPVDAGGTLPYPGTPTCPDN